MFSLIRRLPKYKGQSCKFMATSVFATKFTGNSNTADSYLTNYKNHKSLTIYTRANLYNTIGCELVKRNAGTLSPLKEHEDNEKAEFMSVLPDVINDVREIVLRYSSMETADWFVRFLEYNLPKGKKNRGLIAVTAYKSLVDPHDVTPETLRQAQLLGWCLEMLNAFFLVEDDIMDNSVTRRGQLCWHRLKDVGFTAINDSLMLESVLYILMQKHFRNVPSYLDILELFHEITFITSCGQNSDLLNADKTVDTFSMEKYTMTVINKTSYYTFYLPFAVAMHLAGITNKLAFLQAKEILLEMGHYFQVQDDYLDCFGDPEVTGKIGTDIQDNKCSWLAVTCMQRCNDEQRQMMRDCYGVNDNDKINKVKELYQSLDIPNAFATYEEKSYKKTNSLIEQVCNDLPKDVFYTLLKRIYRRNS